MKKNKPWTIEEAKGGTFFIRDHNGRRIARVYGLREQKIQMAEAIANLPVIVGILDKREKQWEILSIES